MSRTTTNFSWLNSETAEAQYEDQWWDLYLDIMDDLDTELYKAKIVGKETIWIPAGAMQATASNGCSSLTTVETTSGRPDLNVLDFDATTNEYAQFSIAMPKSWNEGTVTFQAFWTTASTGGGTVIWSIQGVAIGDDDTIDVAYGTAQSVTDTALGVAEDAHVTSESSAITIAGTPAVDQICIFRFARDASSDTHASDARLLGVKLFFTTDGRSDD